jgi:hypothetical protein
VDPQLDDAAPHDDRLVLAWTASGMLAAVAVGLIMVELANGTGPSVWSTGTIALVSTASLCSAGAAHHPTVAWAAAGLALGATLWAGASPDAFLILPAVVVTGAAALRASSPSPERLAPPAPYAEGGIETLHHQATFLGDTLPAATSQTAAALVGTSASSATLITTCPPRVRNRSPILSRLLGSSAE